MLHFVVAGGQKVGSIRSEANFPAAKRRCRLREISPSLKFLAARQQAELSPVDADRLGLENGEQVSVSAGDASVLARVFVRGNVPAGTVFLAEATAEQSATELLGAEPRLVEVRPA